MQFDEHPKSLPAITAMVSLAFLLSNSYICSHRESFQNQNQNPPNRNRRIGNGVSKGKGDELKNENREDVTGELPQFRSL